MESYKIREIHYTLTYWVLRNFLQKWMLVSRQRSVKKIEVLIHISHKLIK